MPAKQCRVIMRQEPKTSFAQKKKNASPAVCHRSAVSGYDSILDENPSPGTMRTLLAPRSTSRRTLEWNDRLSSFHSLGKKLKIPKLNIANQTPP
jgi:hypothetical protein